MILPTNKPLIRQSDSLTTPVIRLLVLTFSSLKTFPCFAALALGLLKVQVEMRLLCCSLRWWWWWGGTLVESLF